MRVESPYLEARSMIKVAFIGAHSVGKTTLVFEQAARFKRAGINVGVVHEVARSCPLPINEGTTLLAQTWILMTQITREIEEQHRSAELVITDRSVLDNFAYLMRAYSKPVPLELIAYLELWMRTYDLLIKVPIVNAEIQEDGVRSTNAKFAAEMDQLVDTLLVDSQMGKSVAVHRLSLNRENWNTEAYQRIKELL